MAAGSDTRSAARHVGRAAAVTDAHGLKASQARGRGAAAWYVLADPRSSAVRAPSAGLGFVFFFMQADLFSKIYKKCLPSK